MTSNKYRPESIPGHEPDFDDWDAWSTDQEQKPWNPKRAIQQEREWYHEGDDNGNGKGHHGIVSEPSDKQVSFLASLIDADAIERVTFTKACYSQAIDQALQHQAKEGKAGRAPKPNKYGGKCGKCGGGVAAEAGVLTGRHAGNGGKWGVEHVECPESTPDKPVVDLQGMHRLDDGRIYKVQLAVHGSGRPYAKLLVVGDPGSGGSFEYAPGALKELSEDTKLTIDQAKEYGVLYGVCCVCARTLTDEKSIAAGIGPVCARRF